MSTKTGYHKLCKGKFYDRAVQYTVQVYLSKWPLSACHILQHNGLEKTLTMRLKCHNLALILRCLHPHQISNVGELYSFSNVHVRQFKGHNIYWKNNVKQSHHVRLQIVCNKQLPKVYNPLSPTAWHIPWRWSWQAWYLATLFIQWMKRGCPNLPATTNASFTPLSANTKTKTLWSTSQIDIRILGKLWMTLSKQIM